MRITINSNGEGHSKETLLTMMHTVHMAAIEAGAPHALIETTLDHRAVKFPDIERRRKWVNRLLAGDTNMSYDAWKEEEDRHSLMLSLAALTFGITKPSHSQVRDVADQLTTLIGDAKEHPHYRYTEYVDYVDAIAAEEVKVYRDWVQSELDARAELA